MKKHWLLSAGIAALATPTFAHAQDDPATGTASGTENAAAQPAAEETEDGEIVVTAQGRRQLLQDVPLSVQAVGGEQLQNSGATDIRQLNQLAPSLLVSSTGTEANGSARIRGIGTVGDNPGLESSVAVFIDGVYRSRSGIGLNELGGIERIEVLRGPQGTLFGRNASAGLIHVITSRPEFEFGGSAELSYGNYDHMRGALALTGPISETVAFRIDAVYARRDGFYEVVNSGSSTGDRINNRDRLFVRGQILFEPNDSLTVRLIGDYTTRDESCCGAAYRSTFETFDATPGVPGDFAVRATNRVVDIMTSMGAVFPTPNDRFSRQVAITPGRTYGGNTEDWGVSLQADWDLGGATLTSITAYRDYESSQGGDIDYSTLDLLYRNDDGTGYRAFQTFTQELRLQGSAFDGRLDWLVGGYYAHESLSTRDNLQFGADYGQFLACRLVASVSATAALRDPDRDGDGCLSAVGMGTLLGAFPLANAAGGTDGSQLIAALQRTGLVANVGDNTANFDQTSENFAFFTHNIVNITDRVSLTLGARYTNESKDLTGSFNNNNTFCPAQQAATLPAIAGSTSATVRSLLGGAIQFSCLFNSSSAYNALNLQDSLNDDQITGTAILSFRPDEDWLLYGSYSTGYKAGGFNLDRSALGSPVTPRSNADVVNLRFDAETVTSYELGVKYGARGLNVSVAAFRQEFDNFQLNTFNGLFFLVQNVNGCTALIGGSGADEDASSDTGTCSPDDITPGVTSQGVEIEASASPSRHLLITAGFTYVDTQYEDDLVGRDTGTLPLANELFQLPGNNLSNAPQYVVTGSVTWTPPLGNSGMTGLVYVDTRLTGDFNTGSDLFPEKEQDSFAIVNARVGVRGAGQRWSLELWAQNLFNVDYDQVAFNSPLQAAGSGSRAHVQELGAPFSAQLFSAFLAEPRTFGITGRFRF